jgi:hypothetical protein
MFSIRYIDFLKWVPAEPPEPPTKTPFIIDAVLQIGN